MQSGITARIVGSGGQRRISEGGLNVIVDVKDFELKILEMIAIANQNIKKENDYLLQLKKERANGFWRFGDPRNPHLIIPDVEITIKCLESQVRTLDTALSIAKSVAY